MSPANKNERFELRIDAELLAKVDEWRSEQSDLPSRAEAIRQLTMVGLATKTGRQALTAMKFQVLVAATTPGPGERFEDAYVYAWAEDVFPVCHTSAHWHDAFENDFKVTHEMITDLRNQLDDLWVNRQPIPTFYQLEKQFINERTAWDRSKLLRACRYMKLAGDFDDVVWDAIMTKFEHPTEANAILRPFDRDQDISFT